MADRSTVADSIVLTLLSLAAAASTGAGLLLAGFGAIAGSVDLGDATPIVSRGLLGMGIGMATGGGVALVLRRARGSRVDARGVWQMLLAATLIGLPVVLGLWLGPLVAFWRDVLALASELGVWEQSDWNGTGLILAPAAVVFSVPAVQAFAAIVVALSCVLMLPLVMVRSASILRILFVVVVMTGGLVLAGMFGASSSNRLMPIAERTIRETRDPSGTEQARALALLQRYQSVTQASALTLGWAWLGLLVWVPLLTVAAPYRVESSASDSNAWTPGPEIDSADASERERAYRDAARAVDRSSGTAF